MIITELKPFGILKGQLKKSDKISIVGCGQCATMCGTGGKKAITNIKSKLKKQGYNVVDDFIVSPACNSDLDKKVVKSKGNVILAMVCDSGVYNLKRLFKNKKIISALDTIGLGSYDNKGNLFLIREFE